MSALIDSAKSDAPETTQLSLGSAQMLSSNLALGLFFLTGSMRRDMQILYRFCRTVDDIADDISGNTAERRAALDCWRKALQKKKLLPPELMEMLERTSLDTKWLLALLDGMEADTRAVVRITDSEALQKYAWQVASTVGRASAWLFGVRSAAGEEYAENLGYALQYTNILRDVAEDARMQRIYLPLSDFEREGVRQERFLEGIQSRGMQRLLEIHAQRAVHAFSLIKKGPPLAEAALFRPATAMHQIYEKLLDVMLKDGLQVWKKRYRLSWPGKLGVLAKTFRIR
ncbi:MAG: phytoene/squalene synthase family protein [Chthoniobacterales bacterium]